MEPNERRLMARARRSYELGRLRATAHEMVLVVPAVAVGLLHARWPFTLAAGLAFLAVVTAFSWRGMAWGRAVWPGFLAGAVPLVLPILVPSNSVCWIGGACLRTCFLTCPLAGLAAGLAVGAVASRQQQQPLQFLFAAAVIASFTGLFGCALAGAAGMVGMATGALLGILPAYLRLQARRG